MWIANKSSNFSIKSALKITQETDSGLTVNWRWVWQVCTPQRLRMFLWLVLHKKVLPNAKRFKRRMVSTPQCGICSEDVEDLDHLLRHCPNVQGVWRALQRKGVWSNVCAEEYHEWLQQNLVGPHEDSDWPTKFMITVWYIWEVDVCVLFWCNRGGIKGKGFVFAV